MDNLTDTFLNRLFWIRESNIPARVITQAKQCLIDYVGVTLAGAKTMGSIGRRYLQLLGKNTGPATVIGFGSSADINTAILINGTNAHAIELDDGHRYGMLHPGAPVITPLLTLAECKEISAHDFIMGMVVGYEAAIGLACLIQPSHREKGYHATGTCGTIGAAMGISAALRLTKTQAKAALSTAAISASGILEMQEGSSNLKPYSAGRAALAGFISASVGRTGVIGPEDILGGKRGLMATMACINMPQETATTCNNFAIEGIYRKPYASCRHSHAAIEAALSIRARHGILVKDVDVINVFTYKGAVIGHDHKLVHGIGSAKMSIPFSVAVAFAVGRAGITEYSHELIANEEVLGLASKVNVRQDEKLTAISPRKRAAVVEIKTKDGNIFRERVDFPKGEPENPMTPYEVENKFIQLALYGGRSEKEALTILRVIWELEDIDFHELVALL